jgi:hypothetical protein
MTNQFVDSVSGHPLVFTPTYEVYRRAIKNIADTHHAVHPARHPLLQGIGGKAIRECRGQLVDYGDHHHRYPHEDIEPVLTHNDDRRARYIVFDLAEYLDKGICFRLGSPRARSLTNRQRERLRNSGELAMLNEVAVRDFLVSYVMDRPIEQDYSGLEKEFAEAENPNERRVLGHEVFAAKVHVATASFRDDYTEASRAGLLGPEVPDRPSKLIHDFIGDFMFRDRIVNLMYQNANSGGVAPIVNREGPSWPLSWSLTNRGQ